MFSRGGPWRVSLEGFLPHFSRKVLINYLNQLIWVTYLKVENGVVAYYSVHFPTVITADDSKTTSPVNGIFWDYLDNKLYWPTNSFDGTLIGSRNRRDYYVG